MGVTGLWRLVEPTGKPVPVETLENKVLAVDISIWLHQVVKGYQDARGAPLPNAHLMGLFQRLCKLLYFRIKPVFVFDGAFPDLKKETIAKRQDNKSRYQSESERLKRELALLLAKKTAVNSILCKEISPKKANRSEAGSNHNNDDIFKLPDLPAKETESESESDDEETSSSSGIDLHSVDLESDKFKSLPVKEKYDLLMELKETRKMNSWGRLHELPKKSDNFSDFQMQRLLKRKKVQDCIEETEKEIGSTGMSLNELETLLNEEGIDTKIDSLPTRRIASNENTGYVLLTRDMKVNPKLQSIKELNIEKASSSGKEQSSSDSKINDTVEKPAKTDELEDDLQKAIQMSLECVDEPNTSTAMSKTDDSWTSFMTDSDYSNQGTDSEEGDGFEQPDLTTAKAYIMQYSDFTHKAIQDIVTKRKTGTKKKAPNVDQIIDELNKEKSLIAAELDLSSDEDDVKENTVKLKIKREIEVDNDQISNIIDLNTTNDDPYDSLPDDDPVIDTQASVLAIEETHEVITLDTSKEENVSNAENSDMKVNEPVQTIKQVSISQSDSDDDDDDFEEVTDDNEVQCKPVVELNLEIGKAPENDIFADIFTDQISEFESKEEKIIADNVGGANHFETKIDENNLPKNISDLPVKESNSLDNIQNEEMIHERLEQVEKEKDKENPQDSTNQSQNDNITEELETQFKRPAEVITKPIEPISIEKLNTMVEDIESEEQDLIKEKGRLDRIGRNITEQMTKDAQELLQVFGIPYIVAPMEAEAQCAFLELVKLTDGTITDDSDIWLFGGQTVYKNFFNQKKHVLQFLSERIEKSFNLTREQLILLALLVGSDYTTGLSGVGPVTALEILASFPHKKLSTESNNHEKYIKLIEGLAEFKKWVRSGKRTDNTSLKKKLKNVTVTDDFPSIRVVQAYLEPNVEKSEERFSWGELDVTVLRDYTKAKFGWSQAKLDEIIKPVLKRMHEKQSQRKLQDFFKRKVDFSSLEDQMSKRVKAAVRKMGPELPIDEEVSTVAPKDKNPRKRKAVNKANLTEIGESSNKKKILPKEILSNVLKVKTVEGEDEKKSIIDIKINKTDRYQEVIPQREKDKHGLLQNKMKAIEIFRKTKLDTKRQTRKRRVNLPKEKAELSESSDSD